MRTSALFSAKKLRIFRNLCCIRSDKRGGEPVRTFCGQGGGSIYRDLCGRLLWTASNQIIAPQTCSIPHSKK